MLGEIIKIALLCVLIGCASIPISFTINNSPWVVWLGNAAGSLLSAAVVIYIGERITDEKFKNRIGKRRIGKKVVGVFDEGSDNKRVAKARTYINKHGLKIFSLLCPIFPGVFISTATVYLLDLDKKTYKRWMLGGVMFVSGIYVFGYWWIFVK
jgi:formate/nitrite transporter FocA (FNT family)